MTLQEKQITLGSTGKQPQFGWCVIVIGGPASGKSTVRDEYLGTNFLVYDVDEIKSVFDKRKKGSIIRLPAQDGEGIEEVDLDKATVLWPLNSENQKEEKIGLPYDLSNPKYVSFLHDRLGNLTSKYLGQIFKSASNAAEERLPNILFDITGSNINKVVNIAKKAKEVGYKVAVVWCYVDLNIAQERNLNRPRTIDFALLKAKHAGVADTVKQFSQNKDLFSSVDEFWVVDSGETKDQTRIKKISSIDDLKDFVDTHKMTEQLKRYFECYYSELTEEMDDSEKIQFVKGFRQFLSER